MDIMRPPCIWIDGICYRKNIINPIFQDNAGIPSSDPDRSEEREEMCSYEEPCPDETLDIKQIGEHQYQLNLTLSSALFGFIIGHKGLTKKRLENDTKTRITVPKGDKGDIIIVGGNVRQVESAKTRIDVLINSARQKMPFTHFISIPLNYPCIKHGFLEFKDSVLRECDQNRGLVSSIFQNPEKLHLTIGTLVLLDDAERERAATILTECQQNMIRPLLQGQSLNVSVEGIEYMNDDPAEVDVLYAKIKCTNSTNKLQVLADQLIETFVSSGLMQKQYERVKLHLTVMNTLFRNNSSTTDSKGAREKYKRSTFDARTVLEKFEKYNFGRTEIESIHLSRLHSTGSDGYYVPSSVISIKS